MVIVASLLHLPSGVSSTRQMPFWVVGEEEESVVVGLSIVPWARCLPSLLCPWETPVFFSDSGPVQEACQGLALRYFQPG